MTNEFVRRSPGVVLDALLLAVSLPGRAAADIQTLSRAVLSLQATAERHLSSIDARAGELIAGLTSLQAEVARIEGSVELLTGLEATIEDRMQGLRDDLNTRMLAVEAEVHGMRPSIETVAREVQSIVRLLPDPSDGPFSRLRDTLTSS